MTAKEADIAFDDQRAPGQARVVAISIGGLCLLALSAGAAAGLRQGILVLIGFGAGIALYHASFGFTAAWRRLLTERRSVGVRAQLVMIGATILVFFPLLAQGSAFGQPVVGFINPVGLALVVGAFMFGVGMQLGGGCGSGTLYVAGGGSARMLVTLAAFILGSLIATADPLGWTRWPDLGAHSIVEVAGAPAALVVGFAVIAAAYHAALRFERARHGAPQPLKVTWSGDLWRGPWPLLAGALALAIVNIATLLVAGRPWGITSAFALWGAKAAMAAGLDVGVWPYWRNDPALAAAILTDVASVMNFGLMLGALAAAGAAGRFAQRTSLAWRTLVAAVLGGLLMGVGARLSTGCNIGAFFSGVASGSLHGFAWILFAAPGVAVGSWLRPLFKPDG